MARRVNEGSPAPLGVTLDDKGANIAVFSAHATAIDLCLFDPTGSVEFERVRLPARTGDVFHGHVADIRPGQRYGLRAHGPYDPTEGHRFNANKLLVHPYALAPTTARRTSALGENWRERCPHARARGARRFQRALTQSDLLEPPGRRCGCWSTSPFRFSGLLFADSGSGAGATYGVIDNRSENLQPPAQVKSQVGAEQHDRHHATLLQELERARR